MVLERLSRADVRLVIAERQGTDVAILQDTRAGYMAKYDQLSTLLVEGVLDGPAVRKNAEGPEGQNRRYRPHAEGGHPPQPHRGDARQRRGPAGAVGAHGRHPA